MRRDFVTLFRHPLTLAAGPLQAERPELTLRYKSLTLRDFVAALRHPSPPAAGRCKAQIKNGDQVKLVAIFLVLCGERGIRNYNPTPFTILHSAIFYWLFFQAKSLTLFCFWDIFGIFSIIFIAFLSQKLIPLYRYPIYNI